MQKIQSATMNIKEAWNYQSPIIHTWFLASSLSIMFMLAVFCLG